MLSLRICVIAAFVIAGGRSTSATVVVPASFAEMVDGSELVVHGRVRTVQAQSTGGRRSIESLVTVEVIGVIKGDSGASVTFRVPGGQIGRYRMVMVGAPVFDEGDEVVVFLDGRPPSLPMPFGLHQGVYRVSRQDGVPRIGPLMSVAAGRVVRGDPARQPIPLDDFAAAVRRASARTEAVR